jgi:hypothetical protein
MDRSGHQKAEAREEMVRGLKYHTSDSDRVRRFLHLRDIPSLLLSDLDAVALVLLLVTHLVRGSAFDPRGFQTAWLQWKMARVRPAWIEQVFPTINIERDCSGERPSFWL